MFKWISECSKISSESYLGWLQVETPLHLSWIPPPRGVTTSMLPPSPNPLHPSKCLHPFYFALFNSFYSFSLLVASFHFCNSSSIRVCIFPFPLWREPSHLLNHLVKFVSNDDPHWVVTIIVNLISYLSETYKNMCNSQINSYQNEWVEVSSTYNPHWLLEPMSSSNGFLVAWLPFMLTLIVKGTTGVSTIRVWCERPKNSSHCSNSYLNLWVTSYVTSCAIYCLNCERVSWLGVP